MMNQQMVLPEGGLASFISSNMDEFDDSRLAFGRQNGINSMRDTAERMAQMGRNGDVHIAHLQQGEGIVPREVLENNPELAQNIGYAIANEGADPSAYVVGSDTNSINPYTGQREFFLKKLISGVKNILKAVAPIVIPMALNFIAPGLGAVASGFIGGGITGLVQGKSFKDSMKMGLMGGAIGGITQGFQNYKNTGSIMNAGKGVPGGGFFGSSKINPATGEAYKNFEINQDVKEFFGAKPVDSNSLQALQGSGNPNEFPTFDSQVTGSQMSLTEDPSFMDKYTQKTKDLFYRQPIEANAGTTLLEAKQDILTQFPALKNQPAKLAELALAQVGKGATEAVAGGIRLLPTAAAVLGTGVALGGFDEIPLEEVDDPYAGPSYSETRLAENPDKYSVGSAGNPTYITMADTLVQPDYTPYYEQYLNPVQAAVGGEMYPRRNGYIAGPGTETSDDIPAMLSDGEFVMTAQAVRGVGNGSRQQGVRKMYDMMRAFEGGAVA